MVPCRMVPILQISLLKLCVAAQNDTILQLDRHSLIRAFHEKPAVPGQPGCDNDHGFEAQLSLGPC